MYTKHVECLFEGQSLKYFFGLWNSRANQQTQEGLKIARQSLLWIPKGMHHQHSIRNFEMIIITIVLPLDCQGRIPCYLHTADAKKIARYLDRFILCPHLVRSAGAMASWCVAGDVYQTFNLFFEGQGLFLCLWIENRSA